MVRYGKILTRTVEEQVFKSLVPNKVVILLGPRRVGKTVLIRRITERLQEPYLLLNGGDADTRKKLDQRSVQNYLNLWRISEY